MSDALLKSNDKFQLMLQLAESMGKRSDGFYGFRMTGSFNRLGPVQWMKTSPFPAVGTRALNVGPSKGPTPRWAPAGKARLRHAIAEPFCAGGGREVVAGAGHSP